ncbi:hypothetical protein KIPB_010392 [Kipferlia bialata]|uniref:Uncharacterized protein n=1 Tax=Kipferlia bialata TaxID=797122 RepID=A0A391NPR7_9EUKA|nr:hypothetical protein KIPB_010392 [Kipferlia bialata]|eukprot:g10392.t1
MSFPPVPGADEHATELYLAEQAVYPTLQQGLTELCKQKPSDPIGWLAEWLAHNNPHRPSVEEPEDE